MENYSPCSEPSLKKRDPRVDLRRQASLAVHSGSCGLPHRFQKRGPEVFGGRQRKTEELHFNLLEFLFLQVRSDRNTPFLELDPRFFCHFFRNSLNLAARIESCVKADEGDGAIFNAL